MARRWDAPFVSRRRRWLCWPGIARWRRPARSWAGTRRCTSGSRRSWPKLLLIPPWCGRTITLEPPVLVDRTRSPPLTVRRSRLLQPVTSGARHSPNRSRPTVPAMQRLRHSRDRDRPTVPAMQRLRHSPNRGWPSVPVTPRLRHFASRA